MENNETTSKKLTRKEKLQLRIFLILFVLVIVILLFFINKKGKKADFNELLDELKRSQSDANKRHEILTKLIVQKEVLKKKLNRKFWWSYFTFRLIIVVFWFLAFYIYYLINHSLDLSAIINISQAILIAVLLVYFLVFGSLKSLNEFINSFKMRIENWIYGKYVNLDEEIQQYQLEKKSIEDNEPEIKLFNNE